MYKLYSNSPAFAESRSVIGSMYKHTYLTGYTPSQARAGKCVVRWTDGFDMIISNNLDIKQQTKLQFWGIYTAY